MEHGRKQSFRPSRTKVADGSHQTLAVHTARGLKSPRQDSERILRQALEVLQKIDEQDLLGQVRRDRGPHPKIILAAIELEAPVPQMIVDDRLVMKLCGSNTRPF